MVAALVFLQVIIWVLPALLSSTILPATLTVHRTVPLNARAELSELRAHDRARHGFVAFPVSGSFSPNRLGIYYMTVHIGTPPQEFKVVADTGSDALSIVCKGCDGCPTTTKIEDVKLNAYDLTRSSTSSTVLCPDKTCRMAHSAYDDALCDGNNRCFYKHSYGDDSEIEAYYVLDKLHISTLGGQSPKIAIGCIVSQTGTLTKTDGALDGIFGFGQKPLSILPQLSSLGVSPAQSYKVNLKEISVSGRTLPINDSVFDTTSSFTGTMVDTGTNLAILVEEAFDALIVAINAAVSHSARPYRSGEDFCYVISSSIDDVFPKVGLHFTNGVSMSLRPRDYLLEHFSNNDNEDNAWCLGIQKISGQTMTILGDLVLRDKIIVYDLANQRIGWVNYDCSQKVNVCIDPNSSSYVTVGQLSDNVSLRNVHFMIVRISMVMFVYLLGL